MKRLVKLGSIFVILGLAVLFFSGNFFSSSCCGKQLSNDEVVSLKESAGRGDVKSIWKLQDDASNRGDVEESLFYLRKLGVEFRVGEARYLYFSTIANDLRLFELRRSEAVEQLMTAANEGHATSQFFLAFYYENGQFGFQQNKEEALKWYEAAAKNGSYPAANKVRELEIGRKTMGK
ncbi:hypothetical protein CR152_24585 [Massilia violaceinigra]|uniref:Sel1 repeat family protein n=1 Tax=Massilia violaceinigra TaxID=2045208 RepID=A0A2D2DQT5_9BURK|nr:SEL1-like repeat protein [Massilia violaceinigra]ATQ77341.1 hypothetical protein CR152_24585 [Massilia violaceinigra]